jgi:hypothetical protein
MSAMPKRSMMWRTTYALGAFGFGLLRAYVGVLLGGDAQYSAVLRVVAASPLRLGAFVCMRSALREGRGDLSMPSPKRWMKSTASGPVSPSRVIHEAGCRAVNAR